MAYYSGNTQRALDRVNEMVGRMPVDKATRGLMAAKAEGEQLRTTAGLKEAELALPGKIMESQQAQRDLDVHNSPFNLSQAFGNVGGEVAQNGYTLKNTDDQGMLWLQDQDVPGFGKAPPAAVQALENIKKYYGYVPNDKGQLVDKNGQVLPNYKAGPVLDEFRRIKGMNADPVVARDQKVMRYEAAIASGKLSDQDVKRVQAEVDKLRAIDDIDLRKSYVAKLRQYQAKDQQEGRSSKLLEPMLQEQLGYINDLKAAKIKSSDQAHELRKVELQNKGKTDAARIRASGLAGLSVSERKYQDEIALQNLLGKYGVTEGLNGLESQPLTEEQAQAMKQDAAANGLAVYFDEGEVKDTGNGWNPFDNKMVKVYKVRSITPSGQQGRQVAQATEQPLNLEQDPNALSIREQYQQGKITKEQARSAILGEAQAAEEPTQTEDEQPAQEVTEQEGEKPIVKMSITNPEKGMPLDEALGMLNKAARSHVPGSDALVREAAILGGFAYDEFIMKPAKEIFYWLKKAYSKAGRQQARESIQ